MQPFDRVVCAEEAAVELIEHLAAECVPLVHCRKQVQDFLPDGCPCGSKYGSLLRATRNSRNNFGGNASACPMSSQKENKYAPVEDFLRKPDQTAVRSRKARSSRTVPDEQLGIEPFSEFPVLVVKFVLQLPVVETLLPDQFEQHGQAGGGDQRSRWKTLRKRKRSKRAVVGVGDQARSLEQVGCADRELQRLVAALIQRIEPELIHIRHDSPGRENRIGGKNPRRAKPK